MKKNYLLSIIAVCTCLFTACNKEIDTPQTEGSEEKNEGVITYIRATGNENESKGSIDGDSGSFYWNEGDQIAVWNNGAYQSSIALSAEEGDIEGKKPANATFRFSGALNNRANFAVFPASIADGDHATSGDFSINLPGTYNLDDVAGEKSPVPMIAENDGDNLHFKQLGALLRITLNNLPPSTKSVTIDFNGKKVWGSFPVASTVVPGFSNIVTKAATGDDAGKDVITINITGDHGWIDNQDVNIPVPTGTYTTITVKSLDVDGNCTLQMTRWIKVASGISSNWNPIRTSARKVIASLPAFSVSASKRVAIAPANLIVNDGKYSFHSKPWLTTYGEIVEQTGKNGEYPLYVEKTREDFPEALDPDAAAEEANAASSEARRAAIYGTKNRDLFQWAELTGGTSGSSIDFGTIDGHDDWYLASQPELSYLLRSTSAARGWKKFWQNIKFCQIILTESNGFPALTRTYWYRYSEVSEKYAWLTQIFEKDAEENVKTWGGTCGIFIFPDAWDSNLNTIKLNNNMCKKSGYVDKSAYTDTVPDAVLDDQIDKDGVFKQLIDAGAVFIPAAGILYRGPEYGFSSIGASGGSWSSTEGIYHEGKPDEDRDNFAYDFSTSGTGLVIDGIYGKTQHRNARLVREIK